MNVHIFFLKLLRLTSLFFFKLNEAQSFFLLIFKFLLLLFLQILIKFFQMLVNFLESIKLFDNLSYDHIIEIRKNVS